MQAAIDSAKRRFSVNIRGEIRRLKEVINVKQNGYPIFWRSIRNGMNPKRINTSLVCPMNYIESIKFPRYRASKSTIPFINFFKYHAEGRDGYAYKISANVEEMITKYSLKLFNSPYMIQVADTAEENMLLRMDFDDLVKDVRTNLKSKKYKSIISILINKAIIRNNIGTDKETLLTKNRVILLKTLYEANPETFLDCFYDNEEFLEHMAETTAD